MSYRAYIRCDSLYLWLSLGILQFWDRSIIANVLALIGWLVFPTEPIGTITMARSFIDHWNEQTHFIPKSYITIVRCIIFISDFIFISGNSYSNNVIIYLSHTYLFFCKFNAYLCDLLNWLWICADSEQGLIIFSLFLYFIETF